MSFFLLLSALVVICVNADTPYDKGPRCYDCNYAPSGYVLSKGSQYSAKVGYHSCALRSPYDKKNVDKWGCKSGMCFIRKDYNGLVYRGCANKENLPWGVNPNVQCQYQGSGASKSLYYFCKGDLCNEGMLGESPELCGAAIVPAVPQNTQNQNNNNNNGLNNKYAKQGPDRQGYELRDQPPQRRQKQPRQQMKYPEQEAYTGGNQQQGYARDQPQQGYPSQTNPGYSSENALDNSVSLAEDVCNGDCSYNPSGLFPFDNEGNYFIQCEADIRSYGQKGSHPCTCCKPTVLPCPNGAVFSNVDKVCSYKYY